MLGLGLSAMVFNASAEHSKYNPQRTDFRDETIYFAMTTRFYDGDPKNNVVSWDKQDVQIANGDPDWRGDFAGLIDKLDYIKALGFTAIWITPIVQNASGEDYHGYHAMDFSKVDLRYESRKEWGCERDVKFQDLITAAHDKDIKIILDIVLNHTSNFGESYLNPLFTRNQNIRNQATPAGALIPNPDRLSSNYFEQTGTEQYAERFKYFKNPQFDPHNYYHHYGTGWNWDLPNRWWGQIAGDCVDLNTENNTVAEYLVKCYGEFIKMGVDGFRIDTTGHISRLTFNKLFIPEFIKLGEQYKDRRLNGAPFYMFGECCARFGGVVYRDQHNLSSHFYTWKSPENLLLKFDGSQSYWDSQVLNEGHDSPVGPMKVCEEETDFSHNSTNVFMQNGAWHDPDYSEASGYNVIDFPMHYNFNSAGEAINIARQGDKYYNDASYNVVYVDSHDYCPGPNDGTRFNGGTAQWAENLSLMFTFRGIPCIYYGSEVEFKKGKPIDVGGETNKTPRKDSGRAYFGNYLEGDVTANDFCDFKADGNVAATLNGDLSQHIIRLNQIRAAVPALRKGQYTFDGCSGNISFKRAYKDSYALVAINGGATFSNVPEGTYVDIVTNTTYKPVNGTISVSAPSTQGQLRVLVKDWTGGQVGEDGKFIYNSKSIAKGGKVEFPDIPAEFFYTADDVIGNPAVNFSPAGGTFKTANISITATLNESAFSGWYQIGNGEKIDITTGTPSSFTIGDNMSFGEKVIVNWGAKDAQGEEFTGKAEYKKVDPNATITIYVKAASAPHLYAWTDANGKTVKHNGEWPGNTLTAKTTIKGVEYYYLTVAEYDTVNIIINAGNDSNKTGDIKGIDSDVFYEYDGGNTATKLDVDPEPVPYVALSPKNTSYKTDTFKVTATLKDAESGWYRIDNGSKVELTPNSPVEFTIGEGVAYGATTTVSWSATAGDVTETGSATYTKIEPSQGITIYVKADSAPKLYVWDNNNNKLNGEYPGAQLSETVEVNGNTFYYKEFDAEALNIVISYSGDPDKTGDIKGITSDAYFWYKGDKKYETLDVNVVNKPEVTFSPNGGTFNTPTLDVTATCNDTAVSAWYKIGESSEVTFTGTTTFSIGEGLSDGQNVSVAWGAVNADGETNNGSVTFTKKVPTPTTTDGIHIYVLNNFNDDRQLYVWYDKDGKTVMPLGAWSSCAKVNTGEQVTIGEKSYYMFTIDTESLNLIVKKSDAQSKNFENVTSDVYISWDGNKDTNVTTLPDPTITTGGKGIPYTIYFDNSASNWNKVHIYVYGGANNEFDNHLGEWKDAPQLTQKNELGHHTFEVKAHDDKSLSLSDAYVIFHNGDGTQTGDNVPLVNYGLYNAKGYVKTLATGIDGVTAEDIIVDVANGALYIIAPEATTIRLVKADGTVVTRRVNQGLNILTDLNKGFYIVAGKKVVL